MGTLHSFIGHASQWCKMSPQIETQWNALPAEVKTLVNKVEGSKLSEEGFFAALAKLNLSSRMLIKKLALNITKHFNFFNNFQASFLVLKKK